MNLPRTAQPALLAALLALASHAAWADITVPDGFGDAFDKLSIENTAEAASGNISVLQAKVDELDAQADADRTTLAQMAASADGYEALKDRVAQLEATTAALKRILAKLKDGAVITNYDISTDAATLMTTIRIDMNDGVTDTTLTESIPPSTADTAGTGGGADMLTQMLQQLAGQMGLGGGGNPLSNIQNTLNSLVNGNSPVDPAMLCSPDGKGGEGVAVYDIAAGKVYMPNGEVLEAHSGMGAMMDNPAYVNQRMNGPTPPNTYNLSMRESLFYGVEAIRMTPTDPSRMFGRDGMLAHSKLVRGNNGSHGCVAFADYPKFLAAFKRGEVKQLVVVANASEDQKTCKPPQVNTPNPISQNTPSS